MKMRIELKKLESLLSKRGLAERGAVQRYIDNEVLKLTDPYVPMDTGALKSSGVRHTSIGSGEVKYKTPYARRLYYNPQYNYDGAPKRGGRWFERMKSDHKLSILKGAANLAGGRGER